MCTFNLYLLSQVPITVSILKLNGVLYCRREGLGLGAGGWGARVRFLWFCLGTLPFTGCPLSYSSPQLPSPSWLPFSILILNWYFVNCVNSVRILCHIELIFNISSQMSPVWLGYLFFSLPLFFPSFSVNHMFLTRYTVKPFFKLHLPYKLKQNKLPKYPEKNWGIYYSLNSFNRC